MRRIAVSALRQRIADVLAHVARSEERVVLTRHGRAIGAIVPLSDLRRLERLDGNTTDDVTPTVAAYRESWKRFTRRLAQRH